MPLMILSTQKYKMGTGKLSGKPDEMRGGNLAMELASHPERRGGGMPLMILSTQKYKTGTGELSGKPDEMWGGNWDKLQLDG